MQRHLTWHASNTALGERGGAGRGGRHGEDEHRRKERAQGGIWCVYNPHVGPPWELTADQ